MLDNPNKILETIENLERQIIDTKNKLNMSKKVSIICYIAAGIFLATFVILISLFFTITKNRAVMIFSLITLVIGFIFLLIAIVYSLLVKYMYIEKLNALIKASDLIKKEVDKIR